MTESRRSGPEARGREAMESAGRDALARRGRRRGAVARRPYAPLLGALTVALTVAALAAADTTPPPPPLPAPPAVSVVGTQAGYGDAVVVGPGARLEPATGGAPVTTHLLDARPATREAWSAGWEPGAHVAAVEVASPSGAAVLTPLRFVFDPHAPTLEWEVGPTSMLDHRGLDQGEERRHEPPRRTEPRGDKRVPVLWSPDGRRWLPLLPRDARADTSGALAEWLIATDHPQVFLWALDDGAFAASAPVAPTRRQLVRVWSADALSAVRDLRLRVLPNGDTHHLELVATDLVGNQTTVSWPLGS